MTFGNPGTRDVDDATGTIEYDETKLTLDPATLPGTCIDDPLGTITCDLTSTGDFTVGALDLTNLSFTVADDTALLMSGVDALVFTSTIATPEVEWTYVDNIAEDELVIVPQGPNSIAGTVYVDEDRSETYSGSDTLLANVPVILSGTDLDGNPINEIKLTDSAGDYLFTNIPVGDYELIILPPNSYYDFTSIAGTITDVAASTTT